MTDVAHFESLIERVRGGDRLTPGEIAELAATPDILALGMLADEQRRRLHGMHVTYVRVAQTPFDGSFTAAVPPAAREIRLSGDPGSLTVAVEAIEQARAVAAARVVSGFSWAVVQALAAGTTTVADVLRAMRGAGLDAIAELPLDTVEDAAGAVERLVAAGFSQVRLTIDQAPAAQRAALMIRAAELRQRFPAIRAVNPLPMILNPLRPTTGYDDVRMVAIARLAAPDIPDVQVDWQRYGPKLAQVALTFGANDVDAVSPSDDSPQGRRRAPVEEVRRNIEAAGFTPVERDGRFTVVG
jgi:aminodeoxyfutalosine synthase